MSRGVIYLGGSGRTLIDSSIDVVADRIVRSLRAELWQAEHVQAQLRCRIERDVHVVAAGIGLDAASIELRRGQDWEPVLEIFEVKYLPRFTHRLAGMGAVARILSALFIVGKWLARLPGARRTRRRHADRAPEYSQLDRIQAMMLSLVWFATTGSLIYWVFIGLVVGVEIAGLPSVAIGIKGVLGVVLIVLASVVRKVHIEPFDRWAIDALTFTDYVLDDSAYLDVIAAIGDAVDVVSGRGHAALDLLTFSLGAVLATDTIYPRKTRDTVWALPQSIDRWITMGYPFDQIRAVTPDYFSDRACSRLQFRRWINIVVQDDFMGTDFTRHRPRGIEVNCPPSVRSPDVNPPPLRFGGLVKRGWLDVIPRRRTINHRLYWDERDPCAPTCFSLVAREAGWLDELRVRLS